MIDKRIRAVTDSGKPVAGRVALIYTDAIASGTIDYVPVTYIAMEDDKGVVHQIRPRNVLEIVKDK
jgi:hypothetical protein